MNLERAGIFYHHNMQYIVIWDFDFDCCLLKSTIPFFQSLHMKELAAENVNLKRLYEQETEAAEPVLIIVSPGTDPSQELEELAKEVVGAEKYHQVAMGQGQAEIAMSLLNQCSQEGMWLCLKNLHLVTAWLPVLEKVGAIECEYLP